MPTTSPESELQFYYFGLYAVLKRYRTSSILGWLVVLLGGISIPLGWSVGRAHGILDLALSACTIVAGLALVSHTIASLESYVRIPFPTSPQEAEVNDRSLFIDEIVLIMKDIEEGGWQEAYAAIQKMEELQSKYSLPPL
jgi:hypothetical protein